ncbi:molybdenum cofactor biosynthesis protein 1 isoform X3 [Bombyx mori]|uniref:Molybdenum cofactor biosynthesis protein C n=1 Tax=Bombyx mori TaxID=7091 RepID=A0A8R2M8T3_BOMMO|nr:molybdenum cofactor biosynthesis protein 1 isoform X4 [Bombyx mori]XP_037875329.1 molybdenum cofactor biosynthesis protein 1 isoform X4 [Bombyx mori]
MQPAMQVLHAGGRRAPVQSQLAAVSGRAAGDSGRAGGRRRGQAAAHRRGADAQERSRRYHTVAEGHRRHPLGVHDDQRAGAGAAPGLAAARRPGRRQRVAGHAAPGPLRGHGQEAGFNDDEIGDFIEMTRERDLEVRFIEFMPFAGNEWKSGRLVPHREVLRAARAAHPGLRPLPPRPNDTATLWKVGGYAGTVGFISSMTQHFCATCNRLRLTADGNLKVCLFGAAEVSLRDAVRGGAGPARLLQLVRAALHNKKAAHAVARARSGRREEAGERRGAGGWGAANLRTLADPSSTYRNAKFGAHGEPAHDSHRRVGDLTSRDGRAFKVQGVGGSGRLQARAYCTGGSRGSGGSEPPARLSHLDAQGRARMVDVSSKPRTQRAAAAECELRVGGRLLRLLRDAAMPKGDALTVAEIAGVLGAKRTSDLIPLCHPLALELVRVRVSLPGGECAAGGAVRVRCEVGAEGRTGVEMEALVGAAVAALALYDMCKAVDKHMSVSELRVVHKSGGSTPRARSPPPPLRAPDTTPLDPKETYAPTDLAHF